MKPLRILGFLATLSLAGAAANAAPILTLAISPVGTQANQTAPRDAQDTFLAGLQPGYVTETFDAYSAGTQEMSFATSVGDLTMASAGSGGACGGSLSGCGAGLAILNAGTSPFSGRFATSGSNWLDSFDATHLLFEPEAGVNAVGFFMTDPNDSGGRFSFTLADSEVSLDFGSIFGGALGNGKLFYLTFFASQDISSLSIYSNRRNDGFGIDDVTIGRTQVRVPEPSALALLSLGVIGSGLIRRRRTR